MKIRIGTRGSRLAMWQAHRIRDRLTDLHGENSVELVVISTRGDRIKDLSLLEKGNKGFFTKEIEAALLQNEIDLAVHSAKDLPTRLPGQLSIGVITERANPADVLIARAGRKLHELPNGSTIGTGSLRRRAQAIRAFPGLRVKPIRGNVDTRIRKLRNGGYDAIILAAAGVKRLDLEQHISERLSPKSWLPAVGQGALALEIRNDDTAIIKAIEPLSDAGVRDAVLAERSLLRELEAGCRAPVGAYGHIESDLLLLDAFVAKADGSEFIRKQIRGSRNDAEMLGMKLAAELKDAGADRILAGLTQ